MRMRGAVKGQENRPQIIHSGHFMVSEPHTDPDPSLSAVTEVQDTGGTVPGSPDGETSTIGMSNLSVGGYDFDTVNKLACQTYRFGPRSTGYLNIDASLTKLFECMTLAYSGKIVSPKWKTFKGLKLLWRDKIRLNNAIWRAWYLQYVEKRKNPVCNFVTPLEGLDIEEHRKPEAVLIEGKYWKRRIEIVIREYHIWRTYFKNRLRKKKNDEDLSQLLREDCPWPHRATDSTIDHPMDLDPLFDVDTLMSEFSDTLFSTLAHHPYSWPNPKDFAHFGNADMIQPSLTQLQPNMGEDFMDTFEPLQEYFAASRPLPGNSNFSGPTSNNIFSAGAPTIPAVAALGTSGQTQQGNFLPDGAASLGMYSTAFVIGEQSPYAVPQSSSPTKAVSPVLSPVVFGTDFGTSASFQESPTFLPLFPTSPVINDPELQLEQPRTSAPSVTMDLPSPAPVFPLPAQKSSYSAFAPTGINHSSSVPSLQCSSVVDSSGKRWLKTQSSPSMVLKDPCQQALLQRSPSPRPFTMPKSTSPGIGTKTKQLQRIAPAPSTSLPLPHISAVTPVRTQNTFLAQLLMTAPCSTPQHPVINPQMSPTPGKQISGMTEFHGGILIGAAKQAGVISQTSLPSATAGPTEVKSEDVPQPEEPSTFQSSNMPLAACKKNAASAVFQVWSLQETGAEKSPKKQPVEASLTKSNRRSTHISAEQMRRSNINLGFMSLASLVSPLRSQPNLKNISKAAMLQKTAEYISRLQHERKQIQEETQRLRNEISELNNTINEYQQQLPATGAPLAHQRSSHMTDMFDEYVRTRTLQNWKFWVFSIVVRPLFDSYTETVCTASLEEFCGTVITWLEKHCALPIFRKTVLNSLRQISKTTSILSDPSLVPQQATQAVSRGRKSSMP